MPRVRVLRDPLCDFQKSSERTQDRLMVVIWCRFFSYDINWYKIDINWFQLISIDIKLISNWYHLISIDITWYQLITNWYQLILIWNQLTFISIDINLISSWKWYNNKKCDGEYPITPLQSLPRRGKDIMLSFLEAL